MMKKRGFTLAEMIAAIALLAVFSVIVVQLFAAAQTLSAKTDRLDRAVLCARNLAERWQAASHQTPFPISQNPMAPAGIPGEPDISSLKADLPATYYFSKEGLPVAAEHADFQAAVLMTDDTGLATQTLQITIRDSVGQVIFELTAGRTALPEVPT